MEYIFTRSVRRTEVRYVFVGLRRILHVGFHACVSDLQLEDLGGLTEGNKGRVEVRVEP